MWFALVLLRLSALLPYGLMLALSHGMARLITTLLPSRLKVAETNIGLCFPEMESGQRRELVEENLYSTAMSFFETAMCWWGNTRRLRRLHVIEGMQHLDEAREAGKGVILLGGHYTTLEVGGHMLATHIDDMDPIYKPARNRMFDLIMLRARQRRFNQPLDNNDMRAILRSLKQGHVIWYAPDQDFGPDKTVFAPFMGVEAACLTTTARLAKLSGAPVVPFSSERLADKAGYRLRLQPALKAFPSGDDVEDACRVNAAIEEQVRRTPEQYLWLHRRFKTRPQGKEGHY